MCVCYVCVQRERFKLYVVVVIFYTMKNLIKNKKLLDIVHQMEISGGEPDVIIFENNKTLFYVDCSIESPTNRRSLCYDKQALIERKENWLKIANEFSASVIDYTGLESNLARKWQVQLHLFEVPFYYIEYGFAQLGAIAMWRQYKQNPKQAIENYKNALSLGYTATIPQIYNAAGIKFDFSATYINELMQFLKEEYLKL